MYLTLLTEDEQKELFMQLACLTSVADVASDETHEEAEVDLGVGNLHMLILRGDRENAVGKAFRRKAEETAMLKLFAKEMGIELDEHDIAKLTNEVHKVIHEVSGTTNKALLTRDELRQEFLADAVKKLITDSSAELSTAQKKVMLIEAAAMAYADGECSEMERFVLDTIASCFGIDSAFIDDAADLIVKFKNVTDEGIELIHE